MAKTKAEKAVVLEKLENAFKSATSSVFVHFSKVTVAEESAMRKGLRDSGVLYVVAKKTLIRRALQNLGHKNEELPLEGEVAIAYGGGDDATAPARLIHGWSAKMADPLRREASKLSILGGLFEGALKGQAEMREIATIPPMDSLRGMFANIINSPLQRFAIAMSEVAKTKTQ